jgi:hypothetical protein
MFSLGLEGLIIVRLFFKTLNKMGSTLCMNCLYVSFALAASQLCFFSNKQATAIVVIASDGRSSMRNGSVIYPHCTVYLSVLALLYETNNI